jgi:segregation and condensation protein B
MELKFILEALLFATQRPLRAEDLRDTLKAAADAGEHPAAAEFKKVSAADLEAALTSLAEEWEGQQRSFRLVCVAGAWQLASRPEFFPWVKALLGERTRAARLSPPALETLTIIAYRQPLTRAEIEQIRGVSVDGVMQTLLERELVQAVGRGDSAGRPITYGTTSLFLEYFGLRSLEDLPAADELRRIPISRPDKLLTAELAPSTVPSPLDFPAQELPLSAVESASAGNSASSDSPAP